MACANAYLCLVCWGIQTRRRKSSREIRKTHATASLVVNAFAREVVFEHGHAKHPRPLHTLAWGSTQPAQADERPRTGEAAPTAARRRGDADHRPGCSD